MSISLWKKVRDLGELSIFYTYESYKGSIGKIMYFGYFISPWKNTTHLAFLIQQR